MALRLDGKKLRAIRERKGWTQDDLAAKSGVALNTISRMENGGSCRPASCRDVTQTLGVELKDLVIEEAAAPSEPAPEPARAARGFDEVSMLLDRGASVNLVLHAKTEWRAMEKQLADALALPVLDLENPVTFTRAGLLGEMLRVLDVTVELPPQKPDDMSKFDKQLAKFGHCARLIVAHCDILGEAARREEYGMDFFHMLRHYTTTDKKLGLVLVSRQPFGKLLPTDHPLSTMDITQVGL